jgi:hypothetical protein
MNAPTETDEMNAPTETEADQELTAEDDLDMPQGADLDPAGVVTASVPESSDPAAPGYEGAADADGAWAQPGVADVSDADVSDADVSDADVSDADESDADESDADLSDAGSPSAAWSPSAVVPTPDEEPDPTLASPVAEVAEVAEVGEVADDGTGADERWHEILTMFVDDPRSSVELAAGLVDDSAEALVVFVQERQHALLSAWQGDDAGTEQMRVALQGYRTFWNRIEDLSHEA